VAIAGPHVRRLISSDSVPAGGFTPGTILLGRYRIIGLLGRGGMGEVYRADDLKLGQAVALKFLPPALADDPVRRERFFAEVRITRQVSHPNICRVYDIAELVEPGKTQPRYFLTMEYIDGEDLASLLQRIGYLSNEKALDIARQLVVGLAAAHDRGVLHRDVKPANIMIDGRGRVRITDFGLAVAASDDGQAADTAGTPAYMAPEQLAGKGATVRSDIYALGLVLYELYTGKRAFGAATLPELREQKENTVPTAPSELRPGIDPIVERVVTRCLERDPRSRPASAAQVAASLPGGDPLAAAIAAGETPSPEMVAAGGLRDALELRVAGALLVLGLIGIALAAVVGPSARFFRSARLDASPAVLAARAQALLVAAGYDTTWADTDYGFRFDQPLIDFARREQAGRAAIGTFNPVVFWYRASPVPLSRMFMKGAGGTLATGGVSDSDPIPSIPGEIVMRFDPEGRLRALRAIPVAGSAEESDVAAADWRTLFEYAQLEPSGWREVPPSVLPPSYADRRAAWEGTFSSAPSIPVRIEAASHGGKPVMFSVVTPWTQPSGQADTTAWAALLLVIPIVVTGGGLFFAHRNLRSGRGDRRGANRIVVVFSGLWIAAWVLSEDHVPTFAELNAASLTASLLVLILGLNWLAYIALEPFVRRRWPHVLVAWTRLVRGDWRDPVVGRDVLIGCVAGIGLIVYVGAIQLLPARLGYPLPGPSDLPPTLLMLDGAGSFLALLLEQPTKAFAFALGPLFFVFLLNVVFRRQWVAAVGVVAFFGSVTALVAYGPPTMLWIFAYPTHALRVWILVRSGLLAVVAMEFATLLLLSFPVTMDASAWYASMGFTVIALLVALVCGAFRISLGGRRVFELADA
jgi:serine/threonine-protein kinase